MTAEYKITLTEQMATRVYQPLLTILKSKGAPIQGAFWLEPDLDNYQWTRYDDIFTNEIWFRVKKRSRK